MTVSILFPEIGVPNPNVSTTVGPDGSTGTPWMLGSQVGGYVFGVAAATITAGMAVGVDSAGNANPLTKALADAGNVVGVANCAVATGANAWFQTKGVMLVNGISTVAGALPVYTTGTAGSLGEVSTSQTLLHGIRFTAAYVSAVPIAAFAASQIDV